MEVLKAWEQTGTEIPSPFNRTIKVLLAPDRHDVSELTFVHALLAPGSSTDFHEHDRPELITVVTGRGIAICEGVQTALEPDMVLWVRAGEKHQIRNTGAETMKLANVFVPALTSSEMLGPRLRAAELESEKT